MTVAPNGPLACGVPRAGFVEALNAARKHASAGPGLQVNWILDIRGHPGSPAEVVMQMCEQDPPEGVGVTVSG